MQTTPGDAFRAPARPSAGGAAGGGDRPPADRLARPTALDDARSPRAPAPALVAFVAILAVAAVVPTPWVVIPAIVAVAALQRAVSVIVHADRPAPAR